MKTTKEQMLILTIPEDDFIWEYGKLRAQYYELMGMVNFDMDKHEFTIQVRREGSFLENLIQDLKDMIMWN